jgi:ribonuclease HII
MLERELLARGYMRIAGVDEAGRGALAGPLAVGMVTYKNGFFSGTFPDALREIKDSKQLLPQKRSDLRHVVEAYSEEALFSMISHTIIDRLNPNRAMEYAIRELVERSAVPPDVILLDGNYSFDVGVPCVSVIRGDQRSISIASASIISKVERDALMEEYGDEFPAYGFRRNKGYGTRTHREALMQVGPSPIHRWSYEPLKSRERQGDEDR